jgi:hypothetical protein
MPDAMAEIAAEIDAGEHDVDALPIRGSERNAVRRRAVHAVGFDILELGAFVVTT